MIISIGICAYNEEKNIGRLLEALKSQCLDKASIKEIFVVSSGSYDNTEAIVLSFAERDSRIKLIRQPTRLGKASAINEFLKHASGELCLLVSADVIPEKDAVEKICLPFLDDTVGMVGGQVVPLNRRDNFLGFAGHMLWGMHHKIALKYPKLGEMVIFRNVIKSIPEDIATDEAFIEAAIKNKRFVLKYVPEAIVYNRAPEIIVEFLKQRRRIYAGHLDLKKRFGYRTSTMSVGTLLPIAISYFGWSPRRNLWATGTIVLEAYGRFLGWYDYSIKNKNHAVWEMLPTTKDTTGIGLPTKERPPIEIPQGSQKDQNTHKASNN